MSVRLPRFSAIPAISQAGLSGPQYQILSAVKENLDLLTGAKRGPSSDLARAVVKGQITVQPLTQVNLSQVTAQGAGFIISGASVPSLDDYVTLIKNVNSLAKDVADLRNTLNTLIVQLKG